jgi:hypothetical protein
VDPWTETVSISLAGDEGSPPPEAVSHKAQTGVAGSVVAELAYRNEYIAVRGQTKLADEARARNKCHDAAPAAGAPAAPAAPPANVRAAPPRMRSGSAVY